MTFNSTQNRTTLLRVNETWGRFGPPKVLHFFFLIGQDAPTNQVNCQSQRQTETESIPFRIVCATQYCSNIVCVCVCVCVHRLNKQEKENKQWLTQSTVYITLEQTLHKRVHAISFYITILLLLTPFASTNRLQSKNNVSQQDLFEP